MDELLKRWEKLNDQERALVMEYMKELLKQH